MFLLLTSVRSRSGAQVHQKQTDCRRRCHRFDARYCEADRRGDGGNKWSALLVRIFVKHEYSHTNSAGMFIRTASSFQHSLKVSYRRQRNPRILLKICFGRALFNLLWTDYTLTLGLDHLLVPWSILLRPSLLHSRSIRWM